MLQNPMFERYDELVALAYSGIAEPKPWQSFVECLAEVVDGRDSSMMISTRRNPYHAMLVTSDHAPHVTQNYLEQTLATDVMRIINELEMPQPTAIDEVLGQHRWLRSDLYRNYLKPFHIGNSLLVDVWNDPLLRVRLCVDRSIQRDEFGAEERALVGRLAKHLANAINLRAEVQASRASGQFYQHAMDHLGIGALFLNGDGLLVDANQCGTQLLSQRQGLCLREGKLAVSEGRSGQQFRSMLRGLLTVDDLTPQGIRLLDDNGKALLELVGRRLPGSSAPLDLRTPVVVLLAMPCQQDIKEPNTSLMRDLYGFTACEARLAKLLVQGYSAPEAAELLCVSINTVKTHLKGIFEKTGYNKQSQVVAILNNSAVRLM